MNNVVAAAMAVAVAVAVGVGALGAPSAEAAGTQGPPTTAAASAVAAKASGDTAAEKRQWQAVERKQKLERRVVADGLFNIGSVSKKGLSLQVRDASKAAGAAVDAAGRADAVWAQKWAVAWDGKSGYYRIRNLNSRKYLTVSGKARAGAGLKQAAKTRGSAQLWEIAKAKGGVVAKPAGTSLALATVAKGGAVSFKLQKAKKGAPAAQRFELSRVEALEADKTYYVRNLGAAKRIDVAGCSRDAGAPVGLYAPSATKAQKFRLVKAGASTYRLQNVRSCYFVGSNAKGTGRLTQQAGASGANAFTVKVDCKAAAFTIASSVSGRRLDGRAGALSLAAPSGENAQLFTFSRTRAFKMYLNPGHGWNSNGNGVWDPGASGNGHEEAEFSHDLVHRVEALLADSDVEVVNGEQFGLAFWDRLPKAVALGCDAIVSIHFDAGGGSGTLKMVGAQGRAAGSDELADIVHAGVVSSLGLPDRGRVTRSDITCVNGPIPSMLTEICFMDTWGDVNHYLSRRDAVASGIASAIVQASRTREVIQ